MKSFKEVEKTARDAYLDTTKNSVNRSSLLVPEIFDTDVEISFVNHFLIKRGLKNVSCVITGIKSGGNRINSFSFNIDQPRVYRYCLSEMFQKKAKNYIVEFFSNENLFVPFPAVMVNHIGVDFINTVHAYNRVMNNVFEEEKINEIELQEAAIDIDINSESFVVLHAGQFNLNGPIDFCLKNNSKIKNKNIVVALNRFETKTYFINELFPNDKISNNSILTVLPPPQQLFYGRMLCGNFKKDSNSFSANHTYYDNSINEEYWENKKPSSKSFPFMPDLENFIHIYPTNSPGDYEIKVNIYNHDGEKIISESYGIINMPNDESIKININELITIKNVKRTDIATFELISIPISCNASKRFLIQLVYQHNKNSLFNSIAVGLNNPNEFVHPKKTGFCWGEIINKPNMSSYVGIVTNNSPTVKQNFNLSFFDENGKIISIDKIIIPNASIIINTGDIDYFKDKNNLGENIWYIIKSETPNILAYSISIDNNSNHCTGEHSFNV